MSDSGEQHAVDRSTERHRPLQSFLVFWGLGLVVIFYAFAHAVYFQQDLLGQAPVLDARENVAWSAQIRSGQLLSEPMYRALLYPWLLARFLDPISIAPYLGVFLHLVNALLCGKISAKVWRSQRAGWLSGLVYGVYPVALYFSVQVLDITFAINLFLLGLLALMRAAESRCCWWYVLGGLFGGLAIAARPNFIPAVLLFPCLAVIWESLRRGGSIRVFLVLLYVGLPLAFIFLAQGLVNQRLSGDFRLMPWQGAYNLYAANKDGANGRYFQQSISFSEIPVGANSTRMESEYLYWKAVSQAGSIDDMNAYWRSRLFEDILSDPLRWGVLMLRKVFYVFNDWEQYNNLSYHYQKSRYPLLGVNPLGWGVVLLGGLLALFGGGRYAARPQLWGILILIAAYGAGLLLFFVSARFRLPMVPLVVVLFGGVMIVPWGRLSSLRRVSVLITLVVFGVFIYGNWFGARDDSTFVQDEVLLASAALELGDDRVAERYASQVLDRFPMRQDALRLRICAVFNRILQAEDGLMLAEGLRGLKADLGGLTAGDIATDFIRGVSYYWSGNSVRAMQVWRGSIEQRGSAATSSLLALEVLRKHSVESTLEIDEVVMWELLNKF